MRKLIVAYMFASTQAEQDTITKYIKARPFWMK